MFNVKALSIGNRIFTEYWKIDHFKYKSHFMPLKVFFRVVNFEDEEMPRPEMKYFWKLSACGVWPKVQKLENKKIIRSYLELRLSGIVHEKVALDSFLAVFKNRSGHLV